jgi:hypothetical protein
MEWEKKQMRRFTRAFEKVFYWYLVYDNFNGMSFNIQKRQLVYGERDSLHGDSNYGASLAHFNQPRVHQTREQKTPKQNGYTMKLSKM